MNKSYLGDGVYVEIDEPGNIILTIEDYIEVTNRIVLVPHLYESLLNYLKLAGHK